ARMFISEAKLSTFLSHQNIVQVFDVGRGPDGLFIVMELVNGWDLGVMIDAAAKKNQVLSPGLAAFVASQALAGLCHAYRQTHEGKAIIMAHRDISASNVLISAEGEVKVADFGIARLEAFSNQTEPGAFKGKVAYAAPEVLRGEAATKASDQFALGIVLHEMLTGKHPFGSFANSMAYVDAIMTRAPAELLVQPTALVEIVQKALAKRARDRFESPEAFARALAKFLASSGAPSTTHELAEFTRQLELPPLPSELSARDTVIRGPLPGSFSLRSFPSIDAKKPSSSSAPAYSGPMAEMAALQADWAPSGPQMDASGELQGGEPPAAESSREPKRLVDEDLPLELSRPTGESVSMETSPHVPSPAPQGEILPMDAPALEVLLAAAPKKRRFRLSGAIKWAAVLGIAAVAVLQGPQLYQMAMRQFSQVLKREPAPMPLLEIDSQPPGATVHIGQQELGQTPMFIENIYPEREIEVRLSLKGYQPWTGKFSGGQSATVHAMLRRR
ncbi:MAG TPA: serine/threonine-protein kinase, partial [Myxococcaceae bacterium]|nr:serine/threonine-protein kinase [Myxococcaceae bacterium]